MNEKECNKRFLKSALTRQIYRCCNNDRYISGVLVSNYDKRKYIELLIEEILSENFGKKVVIKRNSKYEQYLIEFVNDSEFKIVKGTEASRGHRYHDLILDSELDNEARMNYGMFKILPYRDNNDEIKERFNADEYGKVVTCNIAN